MTDMNQNIDATIRLLKSTKTSIENNLLKGGIDKKTVSLASRIIQLVEKTTEMLEALSKRLPETKGNIIELAEYSYLFTTQSGFVLLRTKPEHIAMIYNSNENTLSLKSRHGAFSISPSSIRINARGLNIDISPLTADKLRERRDELRILLKYFEKILYNRLVPLVEQRVIRG